MNVSFADLKTRKPKVHILWGKELLCRPGMKPDRLLQEDLGDANCKSCLKKVEALTTVKEEVAA